MSTRGAMVTEIEGDLGRTDLTAYIATKISQAIKQYHARRFSFNLSRDTTIATVVDQHGYTTCAGDFTALADVIEFENVSINDSNQIYTLEHVRYPELANYLRNDDSSGIPTCWTWYAGEFLVYPKPDAVYTINFDAHYKVAEPASDGETGNKWMTDAYDLIMHSAKRRIYQSRIRNPGLANADSVAEQEALLNLHETTVSIESTDKIKGTRF